MEKLQLAPQANGTRLVTSFLKLSDQSISDRIKRAEKALVSFDSVTKERQDRNTINIKAEKEERAKLKKEGKRVPPKAKPNANAYVYKDPYLDNAWVKRQRNNYTKNITLAKKQIEKFKENRISQVKNIDKVVKDYLESYTCHRDGSITLIYKPTVVEWHRHVYNLGRIKAYIHSPPEHAYCSRMMLSSLDFRDIKHPHFSMDRDWKKEKIPKGECSICWGWSICWGSFPNPIKYFESGDLCHLISNTRMYLEKANLNDVGEYTRNRMKKQLVLIRPKPKAKSKKKITTKRRK